ncbi:MAG TPA: phosphatidylinositol-specific phospholipase C1-like protein [Microthrixaceae bacterium]|nr:phosphatidylinositol-specific phospholipase C1-like protein [Microthrixaceae bacterium]
MSKATRRLRAVSKKAALKFTVVSAAALALTITACAPNPPLNSGAGEIPGSGPTLPIDESTIRLNQLQFIGSHNSYHVAPAAPILNWLNALSSGIPDVAKSLGDPALLNYSHAPLTTQLERGLRTFELDLFADPLGNKFAHPLLPQILNLSVPRPKGMDQPGLKVLHIQDIDFISTCQVFKGCLSELKAWSDQNPDHLPIIINLELKDDQLPAPFDATKITHFDSTQLDGVDSEVRSILGDRLITPDDVRGNSPDLRSAINENGWPSLVESRGRFLFFMDNEGKRLDYLDGHPNLEGRVMFTSSGEGQPDGAVLKVNDPGDGSRIKALVEAGYLVRTRADDEVTAPSTTQRDIAFSSGAQVIHTDFPAGEAAVKTGYVVSFGTKPEARCNPVNIAAIACGARALREAGNSQPD